MKFEEHYIFNVSPEWTDAFVRVWVHEHVVCVVTSIVYGLEIEELGAFKVIEVRMVMYMVSKFLEILIDFWVDSYEVQDHCDKKRHKFSGYFLQKWLACQLQTLVTAPSQRRTEHC